MSGFHKQNCKCGAIIAWPVHTDGVSRVRCKVLCARDGKIYVPCNACGAEVCITNNLRSVLDATAKVPRHEKLSSAVDSVYRSPVG